MAKKNIKKILLVNPPASLYVQHDGTKQIKECPLPLGLAYLAAQIPKIKNYETKIYDMPIEDFYHEELISDDTILFGATFEQYEQVLKDYNPDLVGICCMLSNRSSSVLKLCETTKKFNKDITTIVGGHHATALPGHILQENTDFVLFGEADYSFPRLINVLNNGGQISEIDGLAYKNKGKLVVQPQTNFVKDLNNLPFPAWDIVNIEKYWKGYIPMGVPLKSNKYSIMNTSRGCPHICSYCAVPQHCGAGNFRVRRLENVISEMQWLVDKYGIEEVHFFDDNFFVNRKRIKELCKLFISNFPGMHFAVPTGTDLPTLDFELIGLLKKAGFHNLVLGIETGDIDLQGKYVDKKIDLHNIKEKVKYIKDAGLEPSGLFMFGFPDETPEQVKRTVDLATSLELDKIHFVLVAPLPGSQLYNYCIENRLLYEDFDVTKIYYSKTYIKNPNISREELQKIRMDVWKDYMSKRIDIQRYDDRGWSKKTKEILNQRIRE